MILCDVCKKEIRFNDPIAEITTRGTNKKTKVKKIISIKQYHIECWAISNCEKK